MATLAELERERLEWSLETFKEATPLSSLAKLQDEMDEVANEIQHGHDPADLVEEYADCLMCLFDSFGRAGITMEQIESAFEAKLAKNKARVWKKNDNNTYSHVK